jgi:nucleoid-associated protein YgaU
VGGFPQVSGIEFTIDTTKAYDQGEQYPDSTYYAPKSIQRVSIQSVGGKAFDTDAVYTIAVNDFMASGGDTYYAFKAASVNYDLGIPTDEVLMDYITTELQGAVTAADYGAPKGRITVTVADTPASSEESSYTVVEGDYLWKIAEKAYGTGTMWREIYFANRDTIYEPDKIQVGQVITLPAA